ncbi:MAG: hypothetical protein KKB59_10275 [Spirochaetes bacterium]|nr:hypothetical protein [Spirochaetota bacterium]
MKKSMKYFVFGLLGLGVIGAIIENGFGVALVLAAIVLVVFIVIKLRNLPQSASPGMSLPDKDLEKDDFIDWGDANQYHVLNENVSITYQNQKGQVSERNITIANVLRTGDGQLLVHAHCHLRNANRTFYASRIQKMEREGQEVDVESFLNALIENSPDRVYERIEENREEELLALMYIAKLDGRLTKNEREILGVYFGVDPDIFPSFDMTAATYKKVIKTINAWDEEKKAPLRAAMIQLMGKKPDDMKKATVGMLR